MDFFGLLVIIAGTWLIDSAVQGRSPVETLQTILRNPAATRTALKTATKTYALKPISATGAANGAAVPPITGGGGSATGQAATAIAFARAQIGKPYRLGATGPDKYDCSGLVMKAYQSAGFNLPRTTQLMVADPRLTKVSRENLSPGDLVFPDIGHVQIYTGNGMIVEAPRTGLNVREVPMWGFWTARRIPAGVTV